MKKLFVLLSVLSALTLTSCNCLKTVLIGERAYCPEICEEQCDDLIPVYATPKCLVYERLPISVDLIHCGRGEAPTWDECEDNEEEKIPSTFLGYFEPGTQVLMTVGRKNTYTAPFKVGTQRIKIQTVLFSRPIDSWVTLKITPRSYSEDGEYVTAYNVRAELDMHHAYY